MRSRRTISRRSEENEGRKRKRTSDGNDRRNQGRIENKSRERGFEGENERREKVR